MVKMKALNFLQFTACSCLFRMAVADFILPIVPGQQWKKVGYLDMADPSQQCPDSWQNFTLPRASCGKKTNAPCDSLNISAFGASYQMVCGRFRGYMVGTPDAFNKQSDSVLPTNIETYYVDGVSITYGSPGNRHHVYTYAAGLVETYTNSSCPCAGGVAPPQLVGSDYYCESGNPGPGFDETTFHYSDILWDKRQCGGLEVTCCYPPNLPWFCKTFPTPISEDLEVRICMDQPTYDENVGLEFFEMYTLVTSQASSDIPTIVGIDIPALVGISISVAIVSCSLGVMVTIFSGCILRKRSKTLPPPSSTSTLPYLPPPLPPPSPTVAYEIMNLDGEVDTSFGLHPNDE